MMKLMLCATIITFALLVPRAAPQNYIIPPTSFSSISEFQTYWKYNYPWGSTHNGGARMSPSQVVFNDTELNLVARPISHFHQRNEDKSIHYISGTIYAKPIFAVHHNCGFDFQGKFRAPTAFGTWPAIWLTGTNSWPPEIDVAEWKGSQNVWFNKYSQTGGWKSVERNWTDPEDFHEVHVKMQDYNGIDIILYFLVDGVLETTLMGEGMVGAPFWLILDLQMEGSSGSPGPTTDVVYSIRDFSVIGYC